MFYINYVFLSLCLKNNELNELNELLSVLSPQ